MSLGLELFNYIEELYCTSRVCERPTADNEKCIQCREKERIIARLKEMLLRAYENTPYHDHIAGNWPNAPQPAPEHGVAQQQGAK